MANFSAAIDALVAERDRVFLLRVAADYGLKYEDLHSKYLETAEVAIKVPRKYSKKPNTVTVFEEGAEKPVSQPKGKADKPYCTAHTSKKEPCKFRALKGEVFCKRHLKQSIDGEAGPKVKTPKVPKKAVIKPPVPAHTHDLSMGVVETCDLCQSHGNALTDSSDFEIVMPHTGPIKLATVESRLAALLAESDSESDGEAGDPMLAGEDDYEDEE